MQQTVAIPPQTGSAHKRVEFCSPTAAGQSFVRAVSRAEAPGVASVVFDMEVDPAPLHGARRNLDQRSAVQVSLTRRAGAREQRSIAWPPCLNASENQNHKAAATATTPQSWRRVRRIEQFRACVSTLTWRGRVRTVVLQVAYSGQCYLWCVMRPIDTIP